MRLPAINPARFCALALALALVLALAVAGCGDTVVDADKAADTLKASQEDTFGEKVKSAECPSDQKVEAGATFECKLVYAGGRRETVTLEIRNADADLSIVAPNAGG